MLIMVFLVLREIRTKAYIETLAEPATKILTCEIIVCQATNVTNQGLSHLIHMYDFFQILQRYFANY